MDLTQSIIDALLNGVPLDDLEASFPAESLSPAGLESLFTQAKVLGRDPVAYNLLLYLERISRDPWFTVRVMALLVQHSQESGGRLAAMRQTLDAIAATLPDEGDLVIHYQKLNAFYYVLAARSRREAGDLDRALGWYETALGYYRGLGLNSSAERVMRELQSLQVERRALALTPAQPETPAATPAPEAASPAALPMEETAAPSLDPQPSAPAALDEETRALQSRRDTLSIEVQDLEQRYTGLKNLEIETQQRVQTLDVQLQDLQRILDEKQALMGQMDHLSEQEVRLRQTLDDLSQQETEQTARLGALKSEVRLLEKRLEILNRRPVDPGSEADPRAPDPRP